MNWIIIGYLVVLFPFVAAAVGFWYIARKDRKKPEEMTYEYDPKNWDHLNK